MSQLIRNRIVLIKLEATPGTDAAPTVGSNAIEVQNLKIGQKGEVMERDNLRGNISQVAPIIGKHYQEISFDMELKNGGSPGVVPMLDAVLKAANFSSVTSAGSSVVYSPNSQMALMSTATIYVYDLDSGSAVLRKLTGVVLDVDLKLAAGAIGKIAVKGNGLYLDPADSALPTTPTYETTTPPTIQNAAFTYNSVSTFIVKEVDLNLGNSIAVQDNINSPAGVKGFLVTGRKPKGKFTPEAGQQTSGSNAPYDFYSDWANSNPRALSVQVGSASGNIIIINAPNVQIDSLGDGADSGILTKEVSISLGLLNGNDELTLTFK